MAEFAEKQLILHSERLSSTGRGRSTHIFVCSRRKPVAGKSVASCCRIGGQWTWLATCLSIFAGAPLRRFQKGRRDVRRRSVPGERRKGSPAVEQCSGDRHSAPIEAQKEQATVSPSRLMSITDSRRSQDRPQRHPGRSRRSERRRCPRDGRGRRGKPARPAAPEFRCHSDCERLLAAQGLFKQFRNSLKRRNARPPCFIAFSSREPGPASLENARGKVAERNLGGCWKGIADIIPLASPAEAANLFKAADYDPG